MTMRRHLASSAINTAAIQNKAQTIYIWGSNSSCFIPYLPDNIILDSPHLLKLDEIFKDRLPMSGTYKVVDIQLTEKIAYCLVEQSLPDSLEKKLDEDYDILYKQYKTIIDSLKSNIKDDMESFFFYFSLDMKDVDLDVGRLTSMLESKLGAVNDEDSNQIEVAGKSQTTILKSKLSAFIDKLKILSKQAAEEAGGHENTVNMYMFGLMLFQKLRAKRIAYVWGRSHLLQSSNYFASDANVSLVKITEKEELLNYQSLWK